MLHHGRGFYKGVAARRAAITGGGGYLEGRLPTAFMVMCVYFKMPFTNLSLCGQALAGEGSNCCQKTSNKIEKRGNVYFLKIEKGLELVLGYETCS